MINPSVIIIFRHFRTFEIYLKTLEEKMEQKNISITATFLQEDGSTIQRTLSHQASTFTIEKLFDMAKDIFNIGSELELKAEIQLLLPDEDCSGRNKNIT